MHYQFCPFCGKKLIDKRAGDDGDVPFCTQCNKFWFDSFSTCVIILVANEYNEIALLRQGYMSDKYASFVSGYISPGENAENAAAREVKEELGLELENIHYAGSYWFGKKELLMIGFIGFTKKSDFELSSEVDSARWVPAMEAPQTMFPDSPGNAMHPMYRQFLEMQELN